jgi:formin 2
MASFDESVTPLAAQIGSLDRAVACLQRSIGWRELLRVSLALGNYVNGGTPRGAAYGFKIDGLLKLSTVKSGDNKTTMLHFVVKFLLSHKIAGDSYEGVPEEAELPEFGGPRPQNDTDDEEEDEEDDGEDVGSRRQVEVQYAPLLLNKDRVGAAMDGLGPSLAARCIRALAPAKAASRINLSQLKADFNGCKKAVSAVSTEVKVVSDAAAKGGLPNGLGAEQDCLVDVMAPFVEDAEVTTEMMDRDLANADSAFKHILRSLGEDPAKTDTEAFFAMVARVCDNMRVCVRDVLKTLDK